MEERKLRLFEVKVLRRIFVPKRDELTGECRKLFIAGKSLSESQPLKRHYFKEQMSVLGVRTNLSTLKLHFN
jgi:hypothetical protein